MDLRQLTALVAIADHGSFSAAARSLYTVQSNVSTHIARLERELGQTLVDRHAGELTPAGALVVERARRVLRELDDIPGDLASDRDNVAGQTRLGVIGTTARWLMPQVLGGVQRAHPGVRAIVHEGSTSSLLPMLVSRTIDAAVVHLPIDDPEIDVDPLFAEDLMVLAHAQHPLADRDEVLLGELAPHPMLLPPPGTSLRRVVDRAAANQNIVLRVQAEIDGVRLLTSLAFDGYGPAIVPATAVPSWLRGEFRLIKVHGLPRRVVGWAERRRPRTNAATRAVRAITRDLVAARGARQPGVHPGAVDRPLRGTSEH
jgi:LysR family hydrogen peroxide-inducible transcriptional activator